MLYETKMYNVAYSILRNSSQAEDTVQDSFIKLADYLDKIKKVDSDQTKALITTIVRNTAINRYRKNQKEAWLFEFQQEKEITDPSDIIERKIMSIYNKDILYRAAMDMPEIYKELIKLRFYYELTNTEIAEITGVDSATVRKRYERAKKYLYDHIVEEEKIKGGLAYEKGQEKCALQLR